MYLLSLSMCVKVDKFAFILFQISLASLFYFMCMYIFIELNIYLSVYLYVCLPVHLSVISFVLPEWWINVYI